MSKADLSSSAAELPSVPVIFGTAGHIDHGKSSLIKALTDTDPDRLAEEKRRGITIELGFAFLNERIAFIDVPGHEKFVKHMVAGAATVDYAILIVAADDGIMPQTREHLDIINLLDVQSGMVVITKADLVDDEEWLDLVAEEVRELISGTALARAPIIVADSLSGLGMEKVRAAILELAAKKKVGGGGDLLRMPIDRVFTMKGFGTVVTGSILSGTVSVGDNLELLPGLQPVRVKGIQSQGQANAKAAAGQRAAINLHGVSLQEVSRGDVLTRAGTLKPTRFLDCRLSLLASAPAPLKHRQRVRLHVGCAEILARVVLLQGNEMNPGEKGFVQFQLESPTSAMRMDRFVIRRYSPQVTIGGGRILDAQPPRHKRNRPEVLASLERLGSGDDEGMIVAAVEKTALITMAQLSVALSRPEDDIIHGVEDLLAQGELLAFEIPAGRGFIVRPLFEKLFRIVQEELDRFHAKLALRAGMRQGDLLPKLKGKHPKILARLVIERALELDLLQRPGGDLLALPGFTVQLTKNQRALVEEIESKLAAAGLKPPAQEEMARALSIGNDEIKPLLAYLVDVERILCLDGNLFFSAPAVDAALDKISGLFRHKDSLSMSEIREAIDSTRKFALPLLNHFDALGYTRRESDLRVAGPKLEARSRGEASD